MSPFTPFFTEHMYLNLRRAQPGGSAPESVHFCDLPPASPVTEADIHISQVYLRGKVAGRVKGRTFRACSLEVVAHAAPIRRYGYLVLLLVPACVYHACRDED